MRISDWSSDVGSADLDCCAGFVALAPPGGAAGRLVAPPDLVQILRRLEQIEGRRGQCTAATMIFVGPPRRGRPGAGPGIEPVGPVVMGVVRPIERSEERRVGKGRVSTCRARVSRYH